MRKNGPVNLPCPGRRAKELAKAALVSCLILLTVLGSIGPQIPSLVNALFASPGETGPSDQPFGGVSGPPAGSIPSNTVGADPVPDLSVPRTVVSSPDKLLGAAGVIQTSADNLTLRNPAVSLRLLGGVASIDLLLAPDRKTANSYSRWMIEENVNGLWMPTITTSNRFTIIGTNSTGAYLVRRLNVSSASSSLGALTIVYKATNQGPLKWDLRLDSASSGRYRLVYVWRNITSTTDLSLVAKKFTVNFGSYNYTFSWSDVPSHLNSSAVVSSDQFRLLIDLGTVNAGSRIQVDPSIVSTNVASTATANTFQRHIFYDSKGGRYWFFYYNGSSEVYRSSTDGIVWSSASTMPSGWPSWSSTDSSIPAIFNYGQTVVAVVGQANTTLNKPSPWTGSVSVYYSVGNITGQSILWGPVRIAETQTKTCTLMPVYPPGTPCSMTLSTRFSNVHLYADGSLAVSYDWFSQTTNYLCPTFSNPYDESHVRLRLLFSPSASSPWGTTSFEAEGLVDQSNCGQASPNLYLGRSVVLPLGSTLGANGVRVVYQWRYFGNYAIRSATFTSPGNPNIQTVNPSSFNVPYTDEFSAVSDADYGTHVLIINRNDGTANYAFMAATGTLWSVAVPILRTSSQLTSVRYPALTVDYSTSDLYAFAQSWGCVPQDPYGACYTSPESIIMKRRPVGQDWADQSSTFPVTQRVYPWYVGSNYASASASNSSRLLLGWTEGQGPYNVSFASIPIQTAWSPFSSPADPWNRNGLAPYGQYFSNLNEYVSASTGFLTVRQTDLTVPGRSLNLEITRVYIEPSTFTGIPMPISYPWAPLGYAWQLNFPWMMNSSAPPFIQLWNGEGYGIPSAFWSGSSGYIENHQGESFSLTRNSTGIFLYTKTGVSYTFDQNNLNRLVKFTDTAGNNTIAFTYTANNWISYITDTTNRVFLFCYSNGLLSRIDQANGSCGSETGFVRRIAYTYSGSSLTNETDPAGRVTSYRYNAVNSGTDAPWLLSRITYPTRWYTNYTYTTVWLGDGSSYSYRIAKQFLATSSGSPVRQNLYSYTQGDGDPIIASTVKSYNATSGQLQLASYTDYAFAFDRVNRTVSDANHSLVRGYQQRFGLHGEVPREIVLVTDGSGGVGSYTNYYGYDLWGNLIYSRSVINPSANWYHESFNAYYNNGLRPGFYAFEETFSRNQGNSPDNPWSVQNGYWLVKNGAYNGTSISGKQESVFAWANISRADVSIQARVFVGKNVTSSDQRIGIFVHYPGTGISKWGLVLHNRTSNGGMYLEFLDEGNQWLPGANSCTIYTNTWYTFNMTIHGYAGTGWAQADGHTTCTTVTGTFSSSSPAALGNGFGLYPGGYSAQFDNVTVATVAPLITGTGFSNSFYANGAPRPNIHSEVAGIAGLSNSTGAIQPIESYFSYMSWGGLNQQKRRYDSPPVQWVTASTTFDGQYGNPKVTVDARGNSTYYAFSGNYTNAYLTNQTMRDGSTKITTLYAYNFTTGNVRIVTDPMGNVTSYQNDNLGRVKKITYPLGGYAQYAYNDQSNYVDITNENGSKTRQIYDGLSRLTVIDRFLSGTSYSNETFTYTWQDRVATRTDPMGSVYRFQYDALGRTVNSTRPDGKSTLQLYNDLSSWIHSKDEDGNFRCNIYDRLERLISVVERADSSCNALFLAGYYYITSYFYDELGRLTKTTTSDYNNISNPSFETGTFSSWTMTGGMIIRTDLFHSGRYAAAPYYDSTSLKYKAFTLQQNFPAPIRADHVSSLALWYLYANSTVDSIQVLYSDGSYTSTFLPHVVSWTLINAAFDKSKQITGIKVVRTTGVGWNIVMDDVLVSLAETRSYSYDNLNRLKSSSYPDSRSESYVYDNNGNLVQSFDRMNVKTLYSYDSVNRLKTVTFCGATTIIGTSYTYDKNGNLLQMKNENATVTYIYDARNRVLNETSAVNLASRQVVDLGCFGPWGTLTRNGGVSKTYTVGFTYKGEFLDTLMYPTISQLNPDITIKYAYDTLGRVLNVTRLGASTYYARSFTYYKNDQVKGLQFGNGLIGNYTYDNLSRPSTITLSGATTMSLTYSYNNTGTVATVVGTVNLVTVNEQYRHDALQRLTNYTITSSGSATSGWYEYDNVGNRVRQKLNSTITSYAYNSISQLTNSTAYTTPQTKITYGYDLTGNLKTQNVTTTGTVRWTYTWDAANRLLKATNGTGQALYAYDGVGRMVEAVEGASTWFLAYRGTEIMYRNLLNMNNQAYVFAGGLKIARVVDRTAMYYYHTDALGSTRMITYNDATYVFTDNYQPFGKDNGTPKGNLANTEKDRFTGKPVSATTGLYYEYQRWYDPSIGRFISQDPLAGHLSNPQSLNPYVYVTDTPTSSTDPTGMDGGFGSDHRREQCDRDHTLSWCKPLTKEAVEVNVKVMWIFLGVEAAIGIAFVCVVACPAIAASLAIGGPAACEEGGCEDLAGLGTQGLVNTADFFENVGADSTASAVARLAAGQASHVSLVNDIVQLYGEAPNTGPGQLRVTNQLGTYIPDFLSGSEAKSVTYLSRTSQMQIAIQNAIDTGTRFTLYTRPYTELSDPLQGYVDRLIIELIRVPFLS